MLYLPTDLGELTKGSLIDTGALTSAISEADLRKIRLLKPQTISNERPPPEFQVLTTIGHLEMPSATNEFQFEFGVILFKDRFIIETNLTSPRIGLRFPQRNNTILDMRQRVLSFHFLSMHSSMQTTHTLTLTNFCLVH